jgi:hypothetical protein
VGGEDGFIKYKLFSPLGDHSDPKEVARNGSKPCPKNLEGSLIVWKH